MMMGSFVTEIQIMWWRKHIETVVNVLRNLSKWKSPTLTTFKCLALVFIYLWPRFWTKLLRKAIYKWRRGIICITYLFITWNSDQILYSDIQDVYDISGVFFPNVVFLPLFCSRWYFSLQILSIFPNFQEFSVVLVFLWIF